MEDRGMTGIEVLAVLALAGLLAAAVALTTPAQIDINHPPATGRLPVYVPAK